MQEIEIYLRADIGPILQWLQSLCALPPALRIRPQGSMVTRSGRCALLPDACEADVLIVESVAGGFSSVSFTGSALPWPHDVDCARLAVSAIACEARCNDAAWQPDAQADDARHDDTRSHDDAGWYAITPTGEGPIRWSTG